MELCPSDFPIRVTVLSPAEVDEDDEYKYDKEGGHTTAETGPIKLEPGCSRRLVNDLVTVGLTLGVVLVGRFTFGPAHVVVVIVFFSRYFRAADRVKGPLGSCEPVGLGRLSVHALGLFQ